MQDTPQRFPVSETNLPVSESSSLDLALDAYWQAAFSEGKENRNYDTTGVAQRALNSIRSTVEQLLAQERERCAKVCESLVDLDDDTCDEVERCAAAIRGLSSDQF